MKLINKITIDQSPMPSALTVRQYTVFGDPGAVFSLTVTNEDNHFYNFSEELDKNNNLKTAIGFSATPARLLPKTINNNGQYTGSIQFPAIEDDDVYSIALYAESVDETFLGLKFEDKTTYILPNIHKYLDTTVTFSLVSAGSNSVYNDYPSNVTAKGFSSLLLQDNNLFNTVAISWNVTLGSSQFIIARQPVITDFQFATTSTSKTAGSSTKTVEVADITGLSKNMGVSGTGIASGSVIVNIIPGYIDSNNSSDIEDIYIIPKKVITDLNGVQTVGDDPGGTVTIDKSSSYNADVTLTFTGKGSVDSKAFNNTIFSVQDLLLTIDPVITTTDAAVANSATIPITSTDGIKAADTVLITGIGITNTLPHVDAVSNGVNVTASAAQTIENGQTLTFTGSSRSATITANVKVLKFGKDNITLTLALDNILTVG